MSKADFDVIIIGGGIHGAGAAQAAVAQGYKVAVLEQSAIASGTSSRSSKLIHGGLRYLESGQISLVRECLRERRLLLKNAPELVTLKKFYIPVYEHTKRQALTIRAGLSLYSLLAAPGPGSRFHHIPKRKWDMLDGLQTEGLKAVYQYWDAQTDDAALTEAVMNSATELGATLYVPAIVSSVEEIDDGFQVCFSDNNEQHFIHGKLIVNAAGPWANQLLDRVNPRQVKRSMDLVQGTHIVLNGTVEQGIYYLEAPSDGRAVFAMPWKGQLMVGTTEQLYKGDPSEVAPTEAEQQYLLNTLKHYFPKYKNAGIADITKSFAGLRVLPSADKSAFSRPRETVLHTNHVDAPGIVTIYGGKLTAYRATSERLMKVIAPSLPKRDPVANTRKIKLTK